MIEIKIIDAAHKDDINIPNEPFQLIGRMIPSYSDEQWNYSVRYFNEADINNLAACLFYIKTGFHIGGLDTNVYKGTKQEGKADIIFYCDC